MKPEGTPVASIILQRLEMDLCHEPATGILAPRPYLKVTGSGVFSRGRVHPQRVVGPAPAHRAHGSRPAGARPGGLLVIEFKGRCYQCTEMAAIFDANSARGDRARGRALGAGGPDDGPLERGRRGPPGAGITPVRDAHRVGRARLASRLGISGAPQVPPDAEPPAYPPEPEPPAYDKADIIQDLVRLAVGQEPSIAKQLVLSMLECGIVYAAASPSCSMAAARRADPGGRRGQAAAEDEGGAAADRRHVRRYAA